MCNNFYLILVAINEMQMLIITQFNFLAVKIRIELFVYKYMKYMQDLISIQGTKSSNNIPTPPFYNVLSILRTFLILFLNSTFSNLNTVNIWLRCDDSFRSYREKST